MKPFKHIAVKALEAERELVELIESHDAEILLSSMTAQLMFVSPGAAFGDRFGNHPAMLENLAKYCIPRFGAVAKKHISPLVTNRCYELTETVLQGKMLEHLTGSELTPTRSNSAERLRMYSNIVRGSAFPEQTANKIQNIQGGFDKWYNDNVGLAPTRAVDIFYALIKHVETIVTNASEPTRDAGKFYQEKYTSLLNKKKLEDDEQSFVDLFSKSGKKGAFVYGYVAYQNSVVAQQLPTEILDLPLVPQLSLVEVQTFKRLFAVGKSNISNSTHIQRKPFYELSSGKILFSEISNSFDVIWDTFEEIARADSNFYDKRYQRKKAKWLENRAYDHLCKFFPKDSIYQNLAYPDPSKESGTAELDLAVKWGPFLLILEAKAKQFRFESTTGDAGKLRTDIIRNVADSYQQALRAIQYIDSSGTCRFVERGSNRDLTFDSAEIYKIFPVSLSFHHLAGISTQLNELKDLNLFLDNRYPFSICESDLELLTKAIISPDVFLHYISKRLEKISDRSNWEGDELDLFSAYLDSRLLLPNIISNDEQSLDGLFLSGYSGQFDQLMAFERGEYPDKPTIAMKFPEGVEQIFNQLKVHDDSNARFISFALLELDDELLFSISKAISDLSNAIIPHNGFRRLTFKRNDTVISVVGSTQATLEELRENMRRRGLVEKYRLKCSKSIVFGVSCRSTSNFFDSAVYIEFDWCKDENMDVVLQNEPASVPSIAPKVNDPCFCGSGKKYKKCCKQRVEDTKRKYSYLR